MIYEPCNEFHLIYFDPGGTLGWAWFVVDRRAFSRPEHKILRWLRTWDCGEFTGPETKVLQSALELIDTTVQLVGFLNCKIGGEDFDKQNNPGKKENLFSPVRQNAILEWECLKRGIRYEVQARQMRTSVTKERLKLWGFEGSFKKDEFSAMQHGIVRLRRMKQESLKRPWKLNEPDMVNAYWDCACERGARCDLVHPN